VIAFCKIRTLIFN